MLNHKRTALSIAMAVAMAPTLAAAQTAAPSDAPASTQQNAGAVTELDKVQVTGLRRAIEGAISVKRDSTSIVEAISAEDIGRLPDVSIAESLARLPGLAAQRVAGRAQVISVRGLSPDFSTTLLNGREVVSTGDNRSVEFDQYPSELVSGVTVYKTPDAGLVGQGLSGTVDMQTARPLSYNERVIAIGGRYQRNSLGKAANVDPYGNRFNVSYIDQFADRTIGLTIGYAHTDMPIQENQVGLYEPWQQVNAQRQRPGVADGVYFSDGIKALRRTGNQKRDGVMATLQYRPSNAWTSTLDAFHTEAEQIDTANQFELNLSNYNGGYTPGLNITDVRVNDRNTFLGGNASGVYPLVRGMYNKREDKIDAFGWNNEITAGAVKIIADLNYSKATRDELNLENNLQLAPMPQLDTVGVAVNGNGFSQLSPGLNYSNPDALFLTNTIYGSGYGKVPRVEDVLKGARLQASFPMPEALSWFSDLDVGVNYAHREKQKTQPEGNITLGAQGEATVAADLQYAPVNLGFAGIGALPAWNVPATVSRYMLFNPSDDASFLVSKAWTVEEKITTAWLRANLDTEWGVVGVRGNIGVQLQDADQSSQANYWDASQPVGSEVRPIDDGKTYRDWLPSLNLAFQFPYEQTLRFALAKQVARPRVDQLRASLEFGVDTSTGRPGASGGNPMLDPWRANALDISYERYFADRAYIAAAFFYKDLKSYIYTQSRDNYDFSALVAGYVPPPGSAPVLTTGTFSAPQRQGRHPARPGAHRLAAAGPGVRPAGRLRHPGQRHLQRQRRADPRPGKRLQRGRRRHQPARPLQAGVQPHRLLRAQGLRGTRKPTPAFGLHRRDRQLQRQPHTALRGRREHHRRADQLQLCRHQQPGRPDPATAGQQPQQLAVPHLRRNQGPPAGIHRMGPHLRAGCELQVLSGWHHVRGTKRLKRQRDLG